MELINQLLKLKIFVLLGTSLLLVSCDNDNDPKVLYQTYGIAIPVEGESYKFKINTDYGNVLIPASNNFDFDSITRIYGTFSFVDDNDIDKDSVVVNFNYMDPILYKKITNDETDLGDSKVYVRENYVWQSKYNNILNVRFEYNGGSEIHLVNLLYNEAQSNSDTVLLEFRHNDNDDPVGIRINGLVSFDLTSLDNYISVSDSIVYKVTFNRGTTASFLKEWYGVYKPMGN